jgi:hypothetical protein
VNPGGIVIAVVGVWLGCQVFGGHMLERLGVVSTSSGSSTSGAVNRSTGSGGVMTA